MKKKNSFGTSAMLFGFFLLIIIAIPTSSFSAPAGADKLKTLLDSECTNLKKDKLFNLLEKKFPSEIEKGLSPDLLKIMEGVIKRTDFDGIKEEKTVEIIGLVYDAFRKGATLEYLDQIFDVAYAKAVTVDQLYAAANALKEFNESDVPQEIYEEFVYHSIEDKWDPAAIPILARGLIYGVDRGLTPERVARSIMIDLEKVELKKKGAEQLILDAIKFVRKIEPEKWKPLNEAEKVLAARREKKMEMERRKKEVEKRQAEKEIDKRKTEEELQRIRKAEEKGRGKAEQERIARELENKLKAYRDEILKYQKAQLDIDAAISEQNDELEFERIRKAREREEKKMKEIDAMSHSVREYEKIGDLDVDKLFATVERYIGIPYRFGGDSEDGIDCSAFTRRVYREQGVELPRASREQAAIGNQVNEGAMLPGDVLFFDTSIVGKVSHVGVYLDNETFAHASSSKGVIKSSIKERYYSKRFVKVNRIFSGNKPSDGVAKAR